MLPPRLAADPDSPTLARRLLLVVITLGLVLVVVAAVMLVANHDPERLYPTKRGRYRPGGYSILFPQLFAATLYAFVSALALATFFRSGAPAVAAAYALVNALALPFVALTALGPWLAGVGQYYILSPTAAALCCGWLFLAAAVALVYWARKRRVIGGAPRGRSALLAVAELLNTPVKR